MRVKNVKRIESVGGNTRKMEITREIELKIINNRLYLLGRNYTTKIRLKHSTYSL